MIKALDGKLHSFRLRTQRIADELYESLTFRDGLSSIIWRANLGTILLMWTWPNTEVVFTHRFPPLLLKVSLLTTRVTVVVSEEHKKEGL